MEKLKSRKFILAVVSAVIILLKGLNVINLDDDSVWQLIIIVLGWIGVEGAADVIRALRAYTVEVGKESP